jgi:hypothetical protein
MGTAWCIAPTLDWPQTLPFFAARRRDADIPVGVPENGRRFEVERADLRDMSRERRYYMEKAGRI